jgi:hypothetical protein
MPKSESITMWIDQLTAGHADGVDVTRKTPAAWSVTQAGQSNTEITFQLEACLRVVGRNLVVIRKLWELKDQT